jgi:hypothetical protein
MNYIEVDMRKMITEELNKQQKQMADLWASESPHEYEQNRSISDHVFGDKDRIEIPLEHHEDGATPHIDVKNHLENHGFQITDYGKGYAKDKYNRTVKIGRALHATGADKKVIDTFVTDPHRSAKTNHHSDMKVVISRHKYDVAGMSTDRGWKSCLSFGESNEDVLGSEIQKGTHVAYLCHKDDNDIKNPLARIALRPYHSDDTIDGMNGDKEAHTILRPADIEYGHGGDAFSHTVRKWTEQHFPAKPHMTYEKDNDVYDGDNHIRYTVSSHPKTLKAIMATDASKKHNIPLHRAAISTRNPMVLDKYVKHESPELRATVAQYGTQKHLDTLVHDKHPLVLSKVAEHTNDKNHFDKLINDNIDNPDRSERQISRIMIPIITRGKPEHVREIMGNVLQKRGFGELKIASIPHVDDDHLQTMVKSDQNAVSMFAHQELVNRRMRAFQEKD